MQKAGEVCDRLVRLVQVEVIPNQANYIFLFLLELVSSSKGVIWIWLLEAHIKTEVQTSK